MRFRLELVVCVLLGAALACSADATPTVAPTAQVIVVTSTPGRSAASVPSDPSAASGAAAQPSAAPTQAGVSSGPRFSPQIAFSAEANPATATQTFKEGIKRVYAMWDYMNMRDGVTVRREWYLNGDLWLKREEAWNIGKYGAEGTVLDISIFDMEKGLPSGKYELRLYIDNQPQFAGAADLDFRTFTIGAVAGAAAQPGQPPTPSSDALVSPDRSASVLVENGSTLSAINANGVKRTLVTVQAVDGVAWMPDSRHVVYGVKNDDGSGSPFGISYDLFVVDITTGETSRLSNDKENLHLPVVSPDGRYIALSMGIGYGDACAVDREVAIMGIDPATMTRLSLTPMTDFSGLEPPNVDSVAYIDNAPGLPMPGAWQDLTTFKAAVHFTCVEGGSEKDGVYAFDVTDKSASKIADLPKPQ